MRRRSPSFHVFSAVIGFASSLSVSAPTVEHFSSKKTWIPTEPVAINDDGVVIGTDFVIYKDRSVQLLGPLGKGGNSVLAAVNNKGQVVVAQAYNGLYYFLYDPIQNDMRPIGLNGQVQEGNTVRTVHLAYLTGLDDTGRVFGVYGSGHGPCGVVGTPNYGAPGDTSPPAAPAAFTLLGCPGGGDLHIRAMNSKGQITGGVNRQGFLWSNGKLSIFRFPGSMATEGTAINEVGTVAGVFWVGNAISDNGDVAGQFTPGMTPPQKGFTYDGTQFRLLFMSRETPVYVTGINNHNQITGHSEAGGGSNKGFIIDSTTLPIAHMQATPGDLTAAAIKNRKSLPPPSPGDSPLDHSYKILLQASNVPAASTLRALQALGATGPLSDKRRVQDLDTSGAVRQYRYISVEALRARVIDQLSNTLMSQLGAAQQTEQGRAGLVDAVAALTGEQGLEQLREAGELVSSSLVIRQDLNLARARAQFQNLLRSAVIADVDAHPQQVPPRDLARWQPSQISPRQLELLGKTLGLVRDELGVPTATIFLAWAEARGSGVGDLFSWQVVEQLVGLNSLGEQAQAEHVLRALARAPAPSNCPGLGLLKASGGYKDDDSMILRNGPNPRGELADVMGNIGEQLLHEIYAEAPHPAAAVPSVPLSPGSAAAAQAASQASASSPPAPQMPREVANHISSPAGAVFSGSDAAFKDGNLTFMLKAPTDPRNGQLLSFRQLVPLPGQNGKAWIAQDEDGYVIFSALAPGLVMGQVLPKAVGEPVYAKALHAATKP